MKKYYFNQNVVVITKNFNLTDVNDVLNKFSNKIEDGWLKTIYDNREIYKIEVSKVYYNFDFVNFTKSLLLEIQNYFTPEEYTLKVNSGIQEIRLFGGEVFINNDRYEKMISILNSTDKTRSLSMNVGLVKKNKKSTPISYTILTSFSNKHYKSSLPEKIKSFSDNLINFNIDINYHIKTINDLNNKEVSILELCKKMIYDDKGEIIKSMELKLRSLGKKLMYDYNFRNNYSTLSNLTASYINKIDDININSNIIYNAYVELFKNQDTSVISRESKRIIEALHNI